MSDYIVIFPTDLRLVAEALRAYSGSDAARVYTAKRAGEIAAALDALWERGTYFTLTAVNADLVPTMEEALEEAAAEDEAANWQQ